MRLANPDAEWELSTPVVSVIARTRNEGDLILEDHRKNQGGSRPGAALWGANAVNGVINIITKPAHEPQGGLVTLGGGNYDRGRRQARYGSSNGRNLDYRMSGKYLNRNSLGGVAGGYEGSGWFMTRGGFRADWNVTGSESAIAEGSSL
jgi:iron complex outermembrane recepter protein